MGERVFNYNLIHTVNLFTTLLRVETFEMRRGFCQMKKVGFQ